MRFIIFIFEFVLHFECNFERAPTANRSEKQLRERNAALHKWFSTYKWLNTESDGGLKSEPATELRLAFTPDARTGGPRLRPIRQHIKKQVTKLISRYSAYLNAHFTLSLYRRIRQMRCIVGSVSQNRIIRTTICE